MLIAGLIDNLFFSSKLREVAEQLGASVVLCRSADAVPADAARIFVDLSATAFDPIVEIAKLKAKGSGPITAFFSHVQIDTKERAEKAGADEVLPRSVFTQRLTEIISR